MDIDKDLVRRVLAKHYRPMHDDDGEPSWLTFLGHTKDSLWSIDLFRCESILLKNHWVLVIMDQFTRRIIDFGVHAGDIELSRSLVDYFHSHRLRMVFIIDAAIVFILREVMLKLFKGSISTEELYAHSAIILVLGLLRAGSVLLFRYERRIMKTVEKS